MFDICIYQTSFKKKKKEITDLLCQSLIREASEKKKKDKKG